MTFDGLALTAMAAELRSALRGARVQKINQPAAFTIALETYGHHERRWLLLSADPRRPYVYLASGKPGRGVETPSPLLLLLRKHVEGLRIGGIDQPPGERILSFQIVFPAETGERRESAGTVAAGGAAGTLATSRADEPAVTAPRLGFRLIIEAVSQYSNLVLVDAAGTVVEAARRVPATQNRFRVTLPRHPYVAPPGQSKRPIETIGGGACREALLQGRAGSPVWQALVAGFAGLGPLSAREISFRALGDARAVIPSDDTSLAVAASALATAASEVVQPVLAGRFEASVAFDGDTIVAFAPYALRHLGRWEGRSTLSAAAEEFYRQDEGTRAVDIARRALLAQIAAERSQSERKHESLRRALEATARAEEYRERGDQLLAHLAEIPKGATSFHVDGLDIALDPRLSVTENAQAYFKRYKKAKAALREVPALLAETELRLRYLAEVAALADLAETTEAVRALRSEVRPESRGPARQTRRHPTKHVDHGILRSRTTDGTELLIGRSARQNHEVTFELARPDDLWLHARGCPGAHVILRVNGRDPPRQTIEEAAAIAAYFSGHRTAGKVAVDWTRRRFVRRLGADVPGLVSYSGEQTVLVRPRAPRASPPLHAGGASE